MEKLELLNENPVLPVESVIWKSAKWPLLDEFFYVALHRRRLVAVMGVKETTVIGRRVLFVHNFASLKKGFGRKLFKEVEKEYDFIYLQSYSSFDQEHLDSYYESLDMTKIMNGCVTFFYKSVSLTAVEEEAMLCRLKEKSFNL